jgi:ornithine cyclodeaminase/alanine dehydrogenase-like protein (mu-crystallin family)
VVLILNNEIVQKVLTMDECVRAQDEAFRGLVTGDSVVRPLTDVYVPCERPDGYYRWRDMEGAIKSQGVFAIRIMSDVVYWPTDEKGNKLTEEKYCIRPGTYCGLVLLFSTRNGEPLAIINDGHIQHMRVGGGAGLGARYLSREDAHVVAMLGSGGMARTYLQAFCAVRDIRKVRVYSPTRAHREAYAEEMGRTLKVDVEPVSDAGAAVRGADIVSACTNSQVTVLEGAWLEPGMHVTDVQGNELDREVYARANVIVQQGVFGLDAQEGSTAQEGAHPWAYIAGSAEEKARLPKLLSGSRLVEGDYPLFNDLVSGKAKGRTSPRDITLYLNGGNMGLQFAAVGWAVYQKAKELGLGRQIPTEWFLQDIRD